MPVDLYEVRNVIQSNSWVAWWVRQEQCVVALDYNTAFCFNPATYPTYVYSVRMNTRYTSRVRNGVECVVANYTKVEVVLCFTCNGNPTGDY